MHVSDRDRLAKCPDCKKELTEPKKSWAYGVFRVDAYSCDCGANFREYATIHLFESQTSNATPKLEKHGFVLILKNGRWVKA